jgi:hypothetical protein
MTVTHQFGHALEDGTVFVLIEGSPRQVGQFTAGDATQALVFYTTRYDNLLADAKLVHERLKAGVGSITGARDMANKLKAQFDEPNVVGDLTIFNVLATEILLLADAVAAERNASRALAREAALLRKEEIAKEAEILASSNKWKATQARFEELLAEWKRLPRTTKQSDEALWVRFKNARWAFDRARRAHFAELSKVSAESKATKTAIIQEAKKLSTSTDWVKTAKRYQELLNLWKAAPRGNQKDEQKLWNQFREAQNAFYEARSKALEGQETEQMANLEKKTALLSRAEELVPVTDHKKARASFKKILEEWSKIGHVPRKNVKEIEARLSAVENAIKETELEEWRKSDPNRKAFAASTASKFQDNLERLERELESARNSGSPQVEALEAQVESARALLDAAMKHA